MARNIEKNPFSLYDFLGYFIPGAMTLILIFIVYKGGNDILNNQTFDISNFWNIHTCTNLVEIISKSVYNKGVVLVVFILASYILGSLISYLSAITVEVFFTRTFGYPSKFLLINYTYRRRKKYCLKILIDKIKRIRLRIRYIRLISNLCTFYRNGIIANILLFISTFVIQIIVRFWNLISPTLKEYIKRPLDKEITNAIKYKEKLLAEKLLIKDYEKIDDFHRVIMHYVYMNLEKSEVKTDNYIALYGFFRSITLILCLYFDFLLAMGIVSFFIPGEKEFDFYSIIFILCLGFLCFIAFMAFAKFYRRFTLENYMMLLSDTTIKEETNSNKIIISTSNL